MLVIPTAKKSVSNFEHKGAVCSHCEFTVMVFGNDPMPAVCPSCNSSGTIGKLLWHHAIHTETIVTDLLNPAKAVDPVAASV